MLAFVTLMTLLGAGFAFGSSDDSAVEGEDIEGTTGDDELVGTDGSDIIDALAGDDIVNAGAGDDMVRFFRYPD